MYESFYGFTEKPFSLLPDPSFLYLGKKHSAAYAMLEYGLMNQAGFTVITGEVGSGKTTLVRHLLSKLDDDITVGLINNTPKNIGQLLQWVLLAFEQDYREENQVALYDNFNRFVIDQYAQNKRTVLIIDEAQNLQPHILEELRMLSNINADKYQVLQMILVGQPQLLTLLKNPDLLQFRQRIASDYFLKPLDREETGHYILYRTGHAGVERAIFLEEAVNLIYQASKGVPRVINVLCDTALVYGFSEHQEQIDEDLVQSVLVDKANTGLVELGISGDAEPQPEKSETFVSNPPKDLENEDVINYLNIQKKIANIDKEIALIDKKIAERLFPRED